MTIRIQESVRALAGEQVRVLSRPGAGPALLWLHSLGTHAGIWAPVWEHMSDANHVAFDMPGHGGSSLRGAFSVMKCVEIAEALMAAEKQRHFWVVGFSMGGLVSAELAARTQVKAARDIACDGIVLACSYRHLGGPAAQLRLDATEKSFTDGLSMADFAAKYERETATPSMRPEARQQLRHAITMVEPAHYVSTLREILFHDAGPALERLQLPALVIRGANDTRVGPPAHEALLASLPASRQVAIADAGHLAPMEQPAAFARAIHAFVDDARATPAR